MVGAVNDKDKGPGVWLVAARAKRAWLFPELFHHFIYPKNSSINPPLIECCRLRNLRSAWEIHFIETPSASAEYVQRVSLLLKLLDMFSRWIYLVW